MLRPLALAFSFLTLWPLRTQPGREGDLGRALGYFPVVGLGLGAVLAGAAWALQGAPPAVLSVVLVALLALATGGLHLDGLADVFDGLGGGRGDRQRILEIMRDPRLGAHGAVALVLVLVAKGAALAAILSQGSAHLLFVFPALSRWLVVPLVILFPYARPEGLGLAFHRQAGPAQGMVATLAAAPAIIWAGVDQIPALAVSAAAALALSLVLWRRLGGLTGDGYGAAIEVAEAAFLVAAARLP